MNGKVFINSICGRCVHVDVCSSIKDNRQKCGSYLEDRPHGEWIPCSERLPEKHGYYLVTTDGSHNAVIDIAEYGKFFRKPEYEYVCEWNKASRVIAWMLLPEPYKKEGGVE
jgi:hypothetical protein